MSAMNERDWREDRVWVARDAGGFAIGGIVVIVAILAIGLVLCACGAASEPPARSQQQRSEDSAPAIEALRTSKFDEAGTRAAAALALDPRNARAAAVRAIATYRAAG